MVSARIYFEITPRSDHAEDRSRKSLSQRTEKQEATPCIMHPSSGLSLTPTCFLESNCSSAATEEKGELSGVKVGKEKGDITRLFLWEPARRPQTIPDVFRSLYLATEGHRSPLSCFHLG